MNIYVFKDNILNIQKILINIKFIFLYFIRDFEDYNNNHFNLGNLNYNNFPIFQNLINM